MIGLIKKVTGLQLGSIRLGGRMTKRMLGRTRVESRYHKESRREGDELAVLRKVTESCGRA